MGYHTDIEGEFTFDKQLSDEQLKYLVKFNETRRMFRDPSKVSTAHETHRKVGLELGDKAQFFVDGGGAYGQERDASVIDLNEPPGQPSLWCPWVPDKEGKKLVWDESEKPYYYTEWLRYMIDNFFKPWGIKLNGRALWFGEDRADVGRIIIHDNVVESSDEPWVE